MPRNTIPPSLRHEVDRLFDSLVHATWGPGRGEGAWLPALDVAEEPNAFRLEMDLPGVRLSDLTIAATGRTLRIEGRRERVRRLGTEHHRLLERSCGHFVRTVLLPPDADPASLQTNLADGVLTIVIPRRR